MRGCPLIISGILLLVYDAIELRYIIITFGGIEEDSLFADIFFLMMLSQ